MTTAPLTYWKISYCTLPVFVFLDLQSGSIFNCIFNFFFLTFIALCYAVKWVSNRMNSCRRSNALITSASYDLLLEKIESTETRRRVCSHLDSTQRPRSPEDNWESRWHLEQRSPSELTPIFSTQLYVDRSEVLRRDKRPCRERRN